MLHLFLLFLSGSIRAHRQFVCRSPQQVHVSVRRDLRGESRFLPPSLTFYVPSLLSLVCANVQTSHKNTIPTSDERFCHVPLLSPPLPASWAVLMLLCLTDEACREELHSIKALCIHLFWINPPKKKLSVLFGINVTGLNVLTTANSITCVVLVI